VTGQFAAADHMLTARENLVLMGVSCATSPPPVTADPFDTPDLHEAADHRLLTFGMYAGSTSP
jgi:hypothetical protein